MKKYLVLIALMAPVASSASAQEMWAGPSGYVWEYGPIYRLSTWSNWDHAKTLYKKSLVTKLNRAAMARHQALIQRVETNGYVYTAAEALLGPPGLDYGDGIYSGILSELPSPALVARSASLQNRSSLPRTPTPFPIHNSYQKQPAMGWWFFQGFKSRSRYASTTRPNRKFRPTLEPLETRDELSAFRPVVNIAVEQEPETIHLAATDMNAFSNDLTAAYNIPLANKRRAPPGPMYHNRIGILNFLQFEKVRLADVNLEFMNVDIASLSLEGQIDLLRRLRPKRADVTATHRARHNIYRRHEDAYSDLEQVYSVWDDPSFVSILLHSSREQRVAYGIRRSGGPIIDTYGPNAFDGPTDAFRSDFLEVGMYFEETADGLLVPLPLHVLPTTEGAQHEGYIIYDRTKP